MAPHSAVNRFLTIVERGGNRLPHPTLLFIWLSLFILLLSCLLAFLNVEAVHPVSEQTYSVINLLDGNGIRRILHNAVSNFTGFAPVGVVLVVMMGIGVAEHAGLIGGVLKKVVAITPPRAIAYMLAFAGVLSSIGADVGYVVLIPIAGLIYHSFKRPPLAGIAVAFAGVSAGFSANLFLGPVDVMLASISTEAANLVDAHVSVAVSDNYYFTVASALLISLVCGWLSNNIVEPRLAASNPPLSATEEASSYLSEKRADNRLAPVVIFTAAFVALLAFLSRSPNGPLSGELLQSIVPLLAVYFALAGYIYGRTNKVYRAASDAIDSMEKTMATMAYYLVLMFFAAQFVNYFAWSNIGIITAITGATWLRELGLPSGILLLGIIMLAAVINLFVGSASAKWALLAPIFIPMLLLVDIPPAQTQIAYRVGDSVTNIITPLMPYFGIVLAYAKRYQATLGLGSIIAVMLPYSLSLLIVWSVFLAGWVSLGLPLGP